MPGAKALFGGLVPSLPHCVSVDDLSPRARRPTSLERVVGALLVLAGALVAKRKPEPSAALLAAGAVSTATDTPCAHTHSCVPAVDTAPPEESPVLCGGGEQPACANATKGGAKDGAHAFQLSVQKLGG